MKNCLGRGIVFGTIALFATSSAFAAEWRPVSMTVGETPYASYDSFVYHSSDFSDGDYTSSGQFLLSNSANLSAPTYKGETRTEISFQSSFGTPPVVDLNQQTINVSSIYAHAVQADWGCNVNPSACDYRFDKLVWGGVMGWNFGPANPVAYAANADGTFTATWNAADSQNLFNGFGNETVRFTFAAAVPEPSVALTFALGLAVVAGWTRRRERIGS